MSIEQRSKFEELKAIQDQMENLVFESEDRLDIMRPFLESLRTYGVLGVAFKTILPTFNDGDPCVAYVSWDCDFKVEPVPTLETRYNDDAGDDEDDTWEELVLSDEDLEDGWGDSNVIYSLYDSATSEYKGYYEDMCAAYSRLKEDYLNVLLKAGKLEVDHWYRYEWSDGTLFESVDFCY